MPKQTNQLLDTGNTKLIECIFSELTKNPIVKINKLNVNLEQAFEEYKKNTIGNRKSDFLQLINNLNAVYQLSTILAALRVFLSTGGDKKNSANTYILKALLKTAERYSEKEIQEALNNTLVRNSLKSNLQKLVEQRHYDTTILEENNYKKIRGMRLENIELFYQEEHAKKFKKLNPDKEVFSCAKNGDDIIIKEHIDSHEEYEISCDNLYNFIKDISLLPIEDSSNFMILKSKLRDSANKHFSKFHYTKDINLNNIYSPQEYYFNEDVIYYSNLYGKLCLIDDKVETGKISYDSLKKIDIHSLKGLTYRNFCYYTSKYQRNIPKLTRNPLESQAKIPDLMWKFQPNFNPDLNQDIPSKNYIISNDSEDNICIYYAHPSKSIIQIKKSDYENIINTLSNKSICSYREKLDIENAKILIDSFDFLSNNLEEIKQDITNYSDKINNLSTLNNVKNKQEKKTKLSEFLDKIKNFSPIESLKNKEEIVNSLESIFKNNQMVWTFDNNCDPVNPTSYKHYPPGIHIIKEKDGEFIIYKKIGHTIDYFDEKQMPLVYRILKSEKIDFNNACHLKKIDDAFAYKPAPKKNINPKDTSKKIVDKVKLLEGSLQFFPKKPQHIETQSLSKLSKKPLM